ncbi:MAG: YaaA family protein [Pseudomonadota bacterium]|nr:YaaA family protein [Pseudomonadota bacterium]
MTHSNFIITMSPAKKFASSFDTPSIDMSQPHFLSLADELADKLRKLSKEDLQKTMSISDAIASLNHLRYQSYQDKFKHGDPCGLLFAGDAFKSLELASFSTEDLTRAQSSLFIISGLYGLLRPLDKIQPYRLEMGCKIKSFLGFSLPEYWQKTLTDHINTIANSEGKTHHLNLASQEYSQSIDQHRLSIPSINFVFATPNPNGYKIIGIKAKKARGAMIRFLLTKPAVSLNEIRSFAQGYTYSKSHSTDDTYVFLES